MSVLHNYCFHLVLTFNTYCHCRLPEGTVHGTAFPPHIEKFVHLEVVSCMNSTLEHDHTHIHTACTLEKIDVRIASPAEMLLATWGPFNFSLAVTSVIITYLVAFSTTNMCITTSNWALMHG